MKEINEAYDIIQKERAGKTSSSGSSYNGGGSYSGTGGQGGSQSLLRARQLIAAGRYSEAGIILDSIAQNARDAEWNYLKGCVLLQRGWYFDAQKYFEVACYMDPTNAEYQAALQNIKGAAGQYGKTYRSTTGGVSACDICEGLICADCLCECCGGDLIRCC